MRHRNRGSKISLTARGRMLVAAAGLIVLLLGIAALPQSWARDAVAPLSIMLGLFWMGLAALAREQAG